MRLNSYVGLSTVMHCTLYFYCATNWLLTGPRFSTPDQGFPVCSGQQAFDIATCSDVPASEVYHYAMILYCVWQILYFLVVSTVLWGW